MIGEAILKYDSDCRELFPFLPQTARTLLDVGATLVRLDAYRVHDIPTWSCGQLSRILFLRELPKMDLITLSKESFPIVKYRTRSSMSCYALTFLSTYVSRRRHFSQVRTPWRLAVSW
jgi:hypothetical protein